MEKSELIAEIQNKIQPSLTTLEKISKGEKVSAEFVEISLKTLNEAIALVKELDGGYFV
jgi:hypothetical protein